MSFDPKYSDLLLTPTDIAKRIAKEIPDGSTVNLGIGIPTLVANYVDPLKGILFMAENGILGTGPKPKEGEEDLNYINASREPIVPIKGASIFDHAEAFSMIRGGHIDIAILGALQVSENGDLANWTVPGEARGGIGGAMDLAKGVKEVYAVMKHITKDGMLKFLKKCSYPLTAKKVVTKIFTDMALIEITEKGPILKEMATGLNQELIEKFSEPKLIIPSKTSFILKEEE